MGLNPIGRLMGLMMDRWIGGDYEKGLAALKQVCESRRAATPSSRNPLPYPSGQRLRVSRVTFDIPSQVKCRKTKNHDQQQLGNAATPELAEQFQDDTDGQNDEPQNL